MATNRHPSKCDCTMKPKIYRRKTGWRVECNYCGSYGAFAATKDGAVYWWNNRKENK